MPPSTSFRRTFLKGSAAWTGSLAFSCAQKQACADAATSKPLMAYVGTYSNPEPFKPKGKLIFPANNGKGIHLFRVDRESGALTPAGLHEQTTSPTCLTVNAAGTRLYSTNASDTVADGESGSISAFAIDRASGQIKLLNTVSSGGTGPTFVSIHPSGKFLLVANYVGGSVSVLSILENGSLGALTDVHKSVGKLGAKRATSAPPGSFAISGHETPHGHMIQTDPTGKFILSAEMGLDHLLLWKLDESTGKLIPHDPPFVPLPSGDGPRHFAFHPNAKWLYSFQEESSTIVLFDFNAATGQLTPRQTISSLPSGFAGTNMASEILMSPDARYVYASNRLHDSIGIFSVGDTGELTRVGNEWTRGDYPRTFNFDPTGKFLYSCNQKGDAIAAFRVDQKTGALSFTGQYTPVGSPAIIVFVDLA